MSNIIPFRTPHSTAVTEICAERVRALSKPYSFKAEIEDYKKAKEPEVPFAQNGVYRKYIPAVPLPPLDAG